MTTVYLTLRTSSDSDDDDVALRLTNRGGEEVVLSSTDMIIAANSARRAFYRSKSGGDGVYLEARALTPLPSSSSSNSGGGFGSILPWNKHSVKVSNLTLLAMTFPTMLLLSSIIAYWTSGAKGYAAIFPSTETFGIVLKLTLWMCLGLIVAYEHAWFFSSHRGKWGGGHGAGEVKLRVTVEGWASERQQHRSAAAAAVGSSTASSTSTVNASNLRSVPAKGASQAHETEQIRERSSGAKSPPDELEVDLKPEAAARRKDRSVNRRSADVKSPHESSNSLVMESQEENDLAAALATDPGGRKPFPSSDSLLVQPAAPATQTLPPERFIKAEKGDILSAQQRYAVTLAWRKEMKMDTILSEPHPNFNIIKKNYPHFYHLRGRNNEPCYYECPPKMKLQPLHDAGVSMDDLLRHYAMTCEFMWTHIEPSESGKSIYVIDLEGMGIRDFAGDVVDFVKKTSAFTSAHYPERSGSIFIVNVPSWFSIIWNTVKPWVDEVTRQKIKILKSGKAGITRALEERVAIENIPPEYGGKSVPLGQAPEELMFREKIASNNRRYQAEKDGIGE